MSFKALENATQADVLRELLHHWNDARGNRRMPAWSDLKPAAMKAVLPYVWSWKYDRANDRFTGRLAGDRIHKLFGANNAGRPIEDCFPRNYCAAIVPLFKRIVTTRSFSASMARSTAISARAARGSASHCLWPTTANMATA